MLPWSACGKKGAAQGTSPAPGLLQQGLVATAAFWDPLRRTFRWVHRAAHLLGNEAGAPVEIVRRDYRQLLAEMAREGATVGPLAPAVAHFLKVTKSHWRGLFRCYEVAGLPATNNDLERTFGAARYHERRASGRKPVAARRGSGGRRRATWPVWRNASSSSVCRPRKKRSKFREVTPDNRVT